MKNVLDACVTVFDKSPQAFGIAHVILDDAGEPVDFTYAYLNPAMAAMTDQSVEELRDQAVYEMWGGDQSWLQHFYRAAYHDEACEFEAASALLEEFLHVTAFPIMEGYCGFLVQDVTAWVSYAHTAMENVCAGLFFYDARLDRMLLTPSARECCGLDQAYLSLDEFMGSVFGPTVSQDVGQQLQGTHGDGGRVLYEGRLEDGRWLRLSLAHMGGSDRFAQGFLEDFTRTKQAEERSIRRMEVIDSLSRENFALYLVNLDADHIVPYRVRDQLMGPLAGVGVEGTAYTDYVDLYARNYVAPADRAYVAAQLDRATVLRRLDEETSDFSISYRRLFDTDEQYVELRVISLPSEGHNVVLAARNTNHEILEQMRQKAALQSALNLAEHASEAKSTFLTNMSHDFRTPMNSITGFANLALDHLDDTERVRDCLQKIMQSSDHLLDLINDILDVSRIESGKVTLKEEPLDLLELMADVEDLFSEQAHRRGVGLTVEAAEVRHARVLSDQLRLHQILVNTVGNALKFTDAGGCVVVSLGEHSSAPAGYGLYELVVADSGCGMTEDFIDRIFLPFERDGLGYANRTEGTGLGMTITKSLVDLLGGTIDVQSAVGVGSRFAITLALRLGAEGPQEAPAADAGTQELRRFEGQRVLVVDDDALSREIMVEILRDHGLVLEEADDGDTALRMVREAAPFHYDALIMDMRMPRMSGDEAARAIRALDRPDAATLPIIAATADAFEEGYHRARDAGMTAHTTKPINIRELLGILGECLA